MKSKLQRTWKIKNKYLYLHYFQLSRTDNMKGWDPYERFRDV